MVLTWLFVSYYCNSYYLITLTAQGKDKCAELLQIPMLEELQVHLVRKQTATNSCVSLLSDNPNTLPGYNLWVYTHSVNLVI